MIKNIIFDIGGVIFDDKNNNLVNKFKISEQKAKEIAKIAFGENFNDSMLGKVTAKEYINDMKKRYPDIKEELTYLLEPAYYHETFPLKEDVYKIIIDLYHKGYNLYILTNNTKVSYEYVSSKINLEYFKGIVCSYQENIIKPDPEIYKLILNRYNLNINETIFFDDNHKNIQSANRIGLKSIQFKQPKDIIDSLNIKL